MTEQTAIGKGLDELAKLRKAKNNNAKSWKRAIEGICTNGRSLSSNLSREYCGIVADTYASVKKYETYWEKTVCLHADEEYEGDELKQAPAFVLNNARVRDCQPTQANMDWGDDFLELLENCFAELFRKRGFLKKCVACMRDTHSRGPRPPKVVNNIDEHSA